MVTAGIYLVVRSNFLYHFVLNRWMLQLMK
jgi:NADH:ubiquinone oxidoreductase subunit 5 (subunit L)/multisubunit Na+/H+ antiporter MnhA subunit